MWNGILILNIVRAFTLLSLLVMLSGCGEHEVTGQIFVVTQGKDNIKLALVAVGAIPQEEFDQYLKVKQSKKLEQQQLLLPKYIQAKNHLLVAENIYKSTNDWRNLLIEQINQAEKPSKKSEKHIDKLKTEMDDTKAEMDEAKAVMAKYEAFDNAEFLFDGLPQTKFISKTDADGKFALTLPKGKYVIAANSSRNVVSALETYHWLVLVDGLSPNQKLMLSNDNLFETKCNECVKL